MNGCNNCAKRREIQRECPWGGSYHHRGEHGEKIGICNAYKRETNADRIRAMSDEELAAALLRMLDGDVYCTNRPECGEMLNTEDGIPDEWCAKCLLNWLQKPVAVVVNDA